MLRLLWIYLFVPNIIHYEIVLKIHINIALIFTNKSHALQKKFFIEKNSFFTCCTHMTSHAIWIDEISGVMISIKKITKNLKHFGKIVFFKEVLRNFLFPVTICVYIDIEYWPEHSPLMFLFLCFLCWYISITKVINMTIIVAVTYTYVIILCLLHTVVWFITVIIIIITALINNICDALRDLVPNT